MRDEAGTGGPSGGPAQEGGAGDRRLPPSFVACCARSGSTLLRLLLGAHPRLSCPAETDLAVLAHDAVRVAGGLLGEGDGLGARRWARAMADELVEAHLARTGKDAMCDKSLSNAFHLDLLAELWPSARFVLLHRHAMDMVASGLDASPWGLSEYGFAQVAPRSPTDSVVALAAYWADRTARLVDFEARHPERCLRVRYEDLVERPRETLEALWRHLGLEAPGGDPAHELGGRPGPGGQGPADHTIWYTDRVHRRSVGRGARIPPDRLAGALREHLNALLSRLGYATVDDAWGSGGDPAPVPDGGAPPAAVELRVLGGHEVLLRRVVALDDGTADLAPAPGAVVAIDRTALPGVSSGRENLGAALRSRLVRYYGAPLRDFAEERAIFERVRRFLAARLDELVAELDEVDAAGGEGPDKLT